jgi:iron complex transport system substrate-binding protein
MSGRWWHAAARRAVIALAVALSAAVVAACGSSNSGSGASARTHGVTDMTGAKVKVPIDVHRIAEQFPAHTATDIMLGVGDELVAIPKNVKTLPFLRAVFPRIGSVPELFTNAGSVNVEQLLTARPDVVSAIGGASASLTPFHNAGLPAVVMTFKTYPQLIQSIRLAGQVYGGAATQRAAAYTRYLQDNLALVGSRLRGLPASQRPSVVHIASFPPLVVDGGGSIIDQWITLAGGTDAARSVTGPHASVTAEQLLRWNPDVLIVETPGGDQGLVAASAQSVIAALAKKVPGWSSLRAVKEHHVYLDPQGMYPWDRYGPEEALQILWAAETLHPDRFRDINMRARTRAFYQQFFHYTPSGAQLTQILHVGG